MRKIVADLYGGDNGIEELLPGVLEAVNETGDLEVVLAGDEKELSDLLSGYFYDRERIKIIHAPNVITNHDNPTLAVHGDNGYTMSRAFDFYASDDASECLISVGSTGAVFVCSLVKLGLADGVVKPVLATYIPYSDKGRVCILDCGANLEPSADDLVLFARLGCESMNKRMGIAQPSVALLSVGRESTKGTDKLKSAHAMLKESGLNFKGNIEPEDIYSGTCDVVVCDGFTGNMILKNTEAAGRMMIDQLCLAAGSESDKKLVKSLADRKGIFYRFNDYGGALILGIGKPVIKAHGCANAETVKSCIYQALGDK